MNGSTRTVLVVLAVLVVAAGAFLGGMVFASTAYRYVPYGMMNGYGPAMMSNFGSGNYQGSPGAYGPGMIGGMMNGGMVGGNRYGSLGNSQPLSAVAARNAVQSYLDNLGDDDLSIKEIMVFDNGAYAIVEEKSSGIGAFELLVDPGGLSVFPEYGPNMMWNLKYGMMSGPGGYGSGMMAGMMPGWYGNIPQATEVQAEMPVSAGQASEAAQEYLDAYLPGVKVSDEIMPFYGYYTIDLELDGKIVGMLSVNGYSGQVFPHTWHGDFIEESEE